MGAKGRFGQYRQAAEYRVSVWRHVSIHAAEKYIEITRNGSTVASASEELRGIGVRPGHSVVLTGKEGSRVVSHSERPGLLFRVKGDLLTAVWHVNELAPR